MRQVQTASTALCHVAVSPTGYIKTTAAVSFQMLFLNFISQRVIEFRTTKNCRLTSKRQSDSFITFICIVCQKQTVLFMIGRYLMYQAG